ncbi:endonuclease/exonuclease/phosphatase family protein [Streptomyces sp. PLK6-54]|uniref:Endonuclease/exonuclease/phosphatase family protein n=2 Tax=Actinacidiphila acidipaludis TaxID=2873382 RepID=A0ABS7Q1T6_9ACTN|nr:endonuclease/exonuclease/phosphatase family protein [Streptomyces acidipaludis]MBY8876420.1 endonuclease/exonuclease/phosphatase family protein [Streptomyces acidipaludis]
MTQAQSSTDATEDGTTPYAGAASGARARFTAGFLRWWRPRGMWRRGLVTAAFAVALALVLFLHSDVPNRIGNLGSLLETFLPWFGLAVPVLLAVALIRRSATALIAVLLPAVVWLNLFGGLLGTKSAAGGDLTVLTHNVNAQNPDPDGTARDLVAAGADIVALEELPESQQRRYAKDLAAAYRYHSVQGTVGLWSKYPLHGVRPVDIRMGWTRAMRAAVSTPHGQVAVYVAHLPSVRVKFDAGFTAGQRDRAAGALGQAIAHEPLQSVVLLGDLNGTMNDRALASVTAQMRSTQGAAGDGFGFSWPASFPMARIDQILVKGVEPKSSWTLPKTGSDHLPVAARLQLP